MVTLRSETRNQRNEVVQLLIVKVVVPRLANAEEPSGKNERRNQP
jgi:hypothetical protein